MIFRSIKHLNYRYIIIVIIILALIGLNFKKYQEIQDDVVPVWSSHDEDYYLEKSKAKGLFTNINNYLNPERLVYKLTQIRIRTPITYLKREIPLLAYYTPEVLKKSTQTIYQPEIIENKVIQLKFDLRQSKYKQLKDAESERKEKDQTEVSKLARLDYQPIICIYHSHTSETYIDDLRLQDNNGHVLPGNIGRIGEVGVELAKVLSEKYHFKVIHTTKVHDDSYARSYFNSRQTVKEFINSYQDIDLLLDLHRDGIKKISRDAITTMINGERVARIMIVVTNGKFNFAHLNLKGHPEWKRNLSLAQKLAAKMEEMYPGLLHRLEIRDTTYNQDLHPRALLFEMGDYKNNTQEAIRSARLLADVIAALLYAENPSS